MTDPTEKVRLMMDFYDLVRLSRDTASSILRAAPQTAGPLSSDTFMSLGQLLGSFDQALAMIGRDIDQEQHRCRAPRDGGE